MAVHASTQPEISSVLSFDIPGTLTFIFFKIFSLLVFFLTVSLADEVSRVGPRNETGHSARRHNRLMQQGPVLNARGI